MKHVLTLLLACVLTGCVSKSEAEHRAREAYLQGQVEAYRSAQNKPEPTVFVRGDVKTSSIPWTEDLTVAQAIVAAEYLGRTDPKTIILTRKGIPTVIKAHDLRSGQDLPVQAGDEIEIRK